MIRIAPGKPVTKVVTKVAGPVTKLKAVTEKVLRESAPKLAANHERIVETANIMGRPRVHVSAAQKQAAYRARKQAKCQTTSSPH